MLGAILCRGPTGPARILLFALGSRVAGISECESLDRSAGDLGGEDSRERRVNPAAQEKPDRNVRHQSSLDALPQERQQSLDELFFRRVCSLTLRREINVPVTANLWLLAKLKLEHVRGRQHPNAFEDRERAGNVFEAQVMMQRFEIDAALETGNTQ